MIVKKCFTLFFLCISTILFCQDKKKQPKHYAIQLEYLYGNIIKHRKNISHLAVSNPSGVSVSFNKKTTASNKDMANYNFPDYGLTFTYQDFKNPTIGSTTALQFHYNFYFGNRASNNLYYLKVAQGVSYVTNPFDLETNNKNIAFGSHLSANTSFAFNYKRKNILKGIDASIGLLLSHFSNGSTKTPNSGINLASINAGMNYNFDYNNPIDYSKPLKEVERQGKEPIGYNFQFVAGINSTDNLLNKRFPYYTATFYVDKSINKKSILNFGTEVFFSKYLKELIKYNAAAFPEKPNQTGNEDYKRISLITGHELAISKFSILTQIGYYVYFPYKYGERFYERLGIKYYFGKKIFTSLSIKAHFFAAESIDLGIGIRL